MTGTTLSRRKLHKKLVMIVLAVDLYVGSFMFLTDPCQNINRIPYYPKYKNIGAIKVVNPKSKHVPWGASGVTCLCISENPRLNKTGYWVYWPLHWFLRHRQVAFFVYDPTKEAYDQAPPRVW